MEDHLKNKNRLEREWEALCSYQAEPSACSVGQGEQNSKRNRSDAVVACESIQVVWFVCFLSALVFFFCRNVSTILKSGTVQAGSCSFINVVDVFVNRCSKEEHKTIWVNMPKQHCGKYASNMNK